MQEIITLDDERLTDISGRLVGWVGDDNKFYPCGASLTPEQVQAILNLMTKES